MSRRTAVIEEFDDDTDLPLPSHPLPNTGTRGPILEEIIPSDDDEDSSVDADEGDAVPGPATSFRPAPLAGSDTAAKNAITDITPYKQYVFYTLPCST